MKAREKFDNAKIAETLDEYNYEKVQKLYEDAKKEFLSNPDDQIYALRCVANIAMNKVRAKRLKGTNIDLKNEVFKESYRSILNQLKNELNDVKMKIIRIPSEGFFKNYNELEQYDRIDVAKFDYAVINYMISLYKELETFFYNEGLATESTEMYKQLQREIIEKYRYDRIMPGETEWAKLGFQAKQYFQVLWGFIFGFGVSAKHLITVTLIVAVVCGFLYSGFGLVGFEDKFIISSEDSSSVDNIIRTLNLSSFSNFGHGLYYSVVSITNLGSETHFPKGFWGKVIQCFEAIVGYVILGVLVAFFTRKIK